VTRLILNLVTAFLVVLSAFWIDSAHAAELPRVNLNAENAGPRQIEDTTEQAVARVFARAGETLTTALSQNRSDMLDADFVGVALDNLRERVNQQQQSGLHTRYIDRGHNLQAVFYSPEGSAIQLRDVAQFEVQFLDGDKVIHNEQRTETYTVVMTATENRWKVRVLQAALGQRE
jgi:hypothetical protein